MQKILGSENIVIDMNGHGEKDRLDYDGGHGFGKRVLDFMSKYESAIVNTFFRERDYLLYNSDGFGEERNYSSFFFSFNQGWKKPNWIG